MAKCSITYTMCTLAVHFSFMENFPRASARYFDDAGRRDLLPGADGTIRWACRRMTGWRVDRNRLEDALRRYAPDVTIIDGPDWPPALSVSDAMAAGRARRRRR